MTPRCAHFGACGGCQWQDVAYLAQLERKRAQLQALLSRTVPSGVPDVAPVVPMPVGDDGMPWRSSETQGLGNGALGSSHEQRRDRFRVGHRDLRNPHARSGLFAGVRKRAGSALLRC